MSKYSWKTVLAVSALVASTTYAFAQMSSNGHVGTRVQMPDNGAMARMHEMMRDSGMMSRMHQTTQSQGCMLDGGAMGDKQSTGASTTPTMAGQDAFGAIQEIVEILESDPKTDWSKVNIEALRQHLIDMNEVTLHAVAVQRDLDNGIEIAVTGNGRTVDAVKRMVPAHAAELREIGWNAKTEELPNGVRLTVLASEAQPLTKLKALGFVGIMVQGSHHQLHHLMMAMGEFMH